MDISCIQFHAMTKSFCVGIAVNSYFFGDSKVEMNSDKQKEVLLSGMVPVQNNNDIAKLNALCPTTEDVCNSWNSEDVYESNVQKEI